MATMVNFVLNNNEEQLLRKLAYQALRRPKDHAHWLLRQAMGLEPIIISAESDLSRRIEQLEADVAALKAPAQRETV